MKPITSHIFLYIYASQTHPTNFPNSFDLIDSALRITLGNMPYREFETLLTLHCLKGRLFYALLFLYFALCVLYYYLMNCFHFVSAPLDPNPTTDVDKLVNELRLQYRTVCCEFHVNEVLIYLTYLLDVFGI